eukprot:CAMPEP_0184292982 /NCGR_PEP_ID=MMETSP1049-20130417/4604_1 /TAXON_ID=77928 /ORGANISM="Proteomonas sulcata, Strain CCMP704" /LENGTH=237 /DNA_ID=CAMNT_0026600905 /DNA_START=1233 /DNA_END=1946 /DNA_ORIENTATION=-
MGRHACRECLRAIGLEVVLFMHANEWGRASNTGVLLRQALGARVLVAGIPADQAEIEALGREASAAVLYPSSDSKSLPEFLCGLEQVNVQDLAGTKTTKEASLPLSLTKNITVIVVDSTWSQSKSLNKLLPTSLQRVRLDPEKVMEVDRGLASPLRKQQVSGRLCSLTAVTTLIGEIAQYLAAGPLCEGTANPKTLHPTPSEIVPNAVARLHEILSVKAAVVESSGRVIKLAPSRPS